jgi:hypothetical protein
LGGEDENAPHQISLKYPKQPLGDSTHPGSAPKDVVLFPRNRKQRNLPDKQVPVLFLSCCLSWREAQPLSTGGFSLSGPQITMVLETPRQTTNVSYVEGHMCFAQYKAHRSLPCGPENNSPKRLSEGYINNFNVK